MTTKKVTFPNNTFNDKIIQGLYNRRKNENLMIFYSLDSPAFNLKNKIKAIIIRINIEGNSMI